MRTDSVMSSRERLTAAMEGREVDHLPFAPNLAYMWDFLPQSTRDRGQLAFLHEADADPLWRGVACPSRVRVPGMELRETETRRERVRVVETPVGVLRYVYTYSDAGNTWFLSEYPLKTEDDYKTQTWIEERTIVEEDFEPVGAHYSGEGREGLTLGMLLPRNKTAFQFLLEVGAGTEALNYALVDFPETVERLWRTMVERDLDAVRVALRSEHQYFITWEDSSTTLCSPAQYGNYIASEIKSWCDELASCDKAYVQHACGHVRDLLDLMLESGIHGIESLSPPPTGNIPLVEARRKIGRTAAIVGGIEPTILLDTPTGDLEAYIEQVVEDGGGGPFVLANADSCPPGVGIDKLRLISSIARRTRWSRA
jgi:Uroporphyrinogen-III decarboxylase